MSVQILESISENTNKSFIVFALISSLFTYSFLKLSEYQFEFSVLLVGCLISCFFLRKNLFPKKIDLNGALPEDIVLPFYDKYEGELLEKEYLATQIQSYNNAIINNRNIMDKMAPRFKKAVLTMLIVFLLFGIVFLFRFIEGFRA